MIRKSIDIIGHPTPTATFTPPPGAEFEPIHEEIPELEDYNQTNNFRLKIERRVQSACGNAACSARVSMTATPALGGDGEQIVQASYIKCSSEQCPLRGPDSSGDREPRLPKPPLPALAQELHSEPEEPEIEHERLIDVR